MKRSTIATSRYLARPVSTYSRGQGSIPLAQTTEGPRIPARPLSFWWSQVGEQLVHELFPILTTTRRARFAPTRRGGSFPSCLARRQVHLRPDAPHDQEHLAIRVAGHVEGYRSPCVTTSDVPSAPTVTEMLPSHPVG